MINKVVTVYAIVDDLLKAIGYQEDSRSRMSDSEVITTAIVAAMFFGSNHRNSCNYLQQHNLIPNMLGQSRFNRRWHRLSMLMNDLTLTVDRL